MSYEDREVCVEEATPRAHAVHWLVVSSMLGWGTHGCPSAGLRKGDQTALAGVMMAHKQRPVPWPWPHTALLTWEEDVNQGPLSG